MQIVKVDKFLFTAHNQQLSAVDNEMERLREIANNATRTPPRSAHAETTNANDDCSRTRPRTRAIRSVRTLHHRDADAACLE